MINHCPTDEATIGHAAAASASAATRTRTPSPRPAASSSYSRPLSSYDDEGGILEYREIDPNATVSFDRLGVVPPPPPQQQQPPSSSFATTAPSTTRRPRPRYGDGVGGGGGGGGGELGCCEIDANAIVSFDRPGGGAPAPPSPSSPAGDGSPLDPAFLARRERKREEARRREKERERWSVTWSPSTATSPGGDNDGEGGGGGGGGGGSRSIGRGGERGGGGGKRGKRGRGGTTTAATTAAEDGDAATDDDCDREDADEVGSLATDVVDGGWGCGFLRDGRKGGTEAEDDAATEIFPDDGSEGAQSEAKSEASMMVLWRYMGLSSRPYMAGDKAIAASAHADDGDDADIKFTHDLQVGDHVIRWKMLGYLYPIQVHGIVFSMGPDFVTIVDCGLSSYSNLDKVGNFEDGGEDGHGRKKSNEKKTERRRMQIVTLVDENEIKKWTKIRYGEEVQLRVHSSNEKMQQNVKVSEDDVANPSAPGGASSDAEFEQSPSAGLDIEEVEKCVQANIRASPLKKGPRPPSWFLSCGSPTGAKVDSKPPPARRPGDAKQQQKQRLRLPEADPPKLVLARLRFLLEYGEEPFPPPAGGADANDDAVVGGARGKSSRREQNLLPPHHLLYANSECIAVFCKTGRWSTIQAAIFLHTSTVGNVKQTATVAMFLGSQTVTVPASGLWGWFGGTTTLPLFTAQPWLVPALVGGGMVYVGLPMLMLWKAKGTWGKTERRLNDAFWSMCDPDVVVEMIRTLSGLDNGGP